ncbi:Auxin-induced protein 5NG4 [Hordeum vulgare]|nr:Auxin-induced protein 5NG4 [Hordeum vulgare]
MEFVGVTFNPPLAVPERRYPANVIVEDTLHVWAISRWRGPVEPSREFLNLGYAHLNLPPGTRLMFRLNINLADVASPCSAPFNSDSAGRSALCAFLVVVTALSPQFSTTFGGKPKLSSQVAAPFESM